MTSPSPSPNRTSAATLALYEALFRSLPDAVIVVDSGGHIVEASARAEQLFGYSRQELIGQPVESLIPDRFREAHQAHRGEYALRPRTRPMGSGLDLYGRRKDGTEFPVDIMLSSLETAEGRIVSSVIRDISDRKKAEDALLVEISKAVLSNLDVEDLLAAISTALQDAVPHDYATFALHESRTDQLRVHVLRARDTGGASPDEPVMLPVEGSPAGQVFRTHEPLVLSSFETQKGFSPEMFQHLITAGLKSGCWVPLTSGGRTLGTLLVASRREAAFSQEELNVLGRVASQIATAVRHAVTFQQVAELSDKLKREKQHLEEELRTEHGFEEIIGENLELRRLLKQVETIAATDVTVLVLGETGTGKDLVARAIHRLSSRREHNFVKLNCAAIPAGLLESELFGHERGAFTGAVAQKIGRLELAHEGTIFLDEIGDLPLELQPKILRALQEKEFERVGSTRTIPVNARLIAATNRDLAKMVAAGEFRSDLYYRLKVFPITLPPLRERREDIPLLVRYFVATHARKLNRKVEKIPAHVMKALTRWHWPGNIRELENFIERAVILSRGNVLQAPLGEIEASTETPPEDDATLRASDRQHIIRVLKETKGVIAGPKGAAARLGLKRTTLNSKMKKLGITRRDYI